MQPASTVRHSRCLTGTAPPSLRSAPRRAVRISGPVPVFEPATTPFRDQLIVLSRKRLSRMFFWFHLMVLFHRPQASAQSVPDRHSPPSLCSASRRCADLPVTQPAGLFMPPVSIWGAPSTISFPSDRKVHRRGFASPRGSVLWFEPRHGRAKVGFVPASLGPGALAWHRSAGDRVAPGSPIPTPKCICAASTG